jgi:hypothetical protein
MSAWLSQWITTTAGREKIWLVEPPWPKRPRSKRSPPATEKTLC